jgi:hypothetical protein
MPHQLLQNGGHDPVGPTGADRAAEIVGYSANLLVSRLTRTLARLPIADMDQLLDRKSSFARRLVSRQRPRSVRLGDLGNCGEVVSLERNVAFQAGRGI